MKSLKDRLKRTHEQALGSTQAPRVRARSSSPGVSPVPVAHSPSITAPSGLIHEVTMASHGNRGGNPGNTWSRLHGFRQVLRASSGLLGPLGSVMEDLAGCVDMHEDSLQARKDYVALKVELEALFSTLSTYFSGDVPPTMTASMDNLCRAISSELDRVLEKERRGTGRRHLEAKKDLDDLVECYKRIHEHLARLTLNADLSTWKIVDEQATEGRLARLAPSMSACYDSAEATLVRRRECTPETRKQVLADLSSWRHDRQQPSLYWMNGMAGTGKTTIANSLCVMLDQSHELGASFFCTRQLPECRNVKFILPTIVYQLARFSRPFRCALSRALERDPDLHTKALVKQFEGLFVGPMREVMRTLPTNLVVVIDALDECDDSAGVAQLLGMLVKQAPDLPVKVFVSSRPEPQVRQKIGKQGAQLILHELEESIVKGDIMTYLRVELECMSLSNAKLNALVNRAGVLFIYAATAVRYISEEDFSLNPMKRLDNILERRISEPSNKNQEIDELYTLVIASALDQPKLERSDREQIKLVLDTVVCAQAPLTVDALASLLQLPNSDLIHAALRPLWSVLHVSGAASVVNTLHASFPDYMLDLNRSKQYGCEGELHHTALSELCFRRIERNKRKFNICHLESSHLLDEQVPDLEDRVRLAIPLDLSYSCLYWAVHLERGGQSNEHTGLLENFLSMRLLLWMEVLNLTNQMSAGPSLLEKARGWCVDTGRSKYLKELVHDSWRFTTVFTANPVSRSTPHIYISMLASWPASRPLAAHYVQRAQGLVGFVGDKMTSRQLALLGAYTANSQIYAIAFSPDSTRVASGSIDKAVSVWDVQSGQMVLGPLAGHDKNVTSVSFSLDGVYLASGSLDCTMRVWNAQTGELLAGPLVHTGKVESIAFSSDSIHAVSGSADGKITVWDTESGEITLQSQTGSVCAVAFSPDRTRIASGSDENLIYIWSAENGEILLGPLLGHTEEITSVAFSPDSRRVVSGSWDYSICVWDSHSGDMVLGPLTGHTNTVWSVAFSPDGHHIASGSEDRTIILWDADNGNVALGPLERHTGSIRSVAFSPDGTRVVSGSLDKTICVWDAQTKEAARGSPIGHMKSIQCVAASPNGNYIASGSSDASIRVWGADDEQVPLKTLTGHTGHINSIAFSPDSLWIVSASSDGSVYLWDIQSGERLASLLKQADQIVSSVVFSPDGARIVSGSDDNTICLWNAKSGEMVLGPLEGHLHGIESVAFSPDGGRIASSSSDHSIRVWDANSGLQLLGPLERHRSWVSSVSFSPDSLLLVSGSHDKSIYLWDSKTGAVVRGPLTGHTGRITTVAFSPDGIHVASGSDDKTIIVWDSKSGDIVLGPLKGHVLMVTSVAFSPNGARLYSGSADKSIRVWQIPCATFGSPAIGGPSSTPSHFHSSTVAPPLGQTGEPAAPRPTWAIDESGWVLDQDGRLLVWVPSDLRDYLLMPLNTMLIAPDGSVKLEFGNAKLGSSWNECYPGA